MIESDKTKIGEESIRLFETLNAYSIAPDVLEAGLKDFSIEAKNELVAHVARSFEPPPTGRLLARLQFILSDKNRPDMIAAFIVNLRSGDPEARKHSLYGLQKLNYPALEDFALLSLRDDNDNVLFAACHILLPKAKQEVRFWKILQGVYDSHKDKKEFYMSMSLLKAHGFQ